MTTTTLEDQLSPPTMPTIEVRTRSPWELTTAAQPAAALTENVEAAVCVIGGGITGMTAALELARAGRDVVLVDAGTLASGESSLTTAHLTAFPDGGIADVVKRFDVDVARHVWNAGLAGLAKIRALRAEHDIECDYLHVHGHFVTESEEHVERIETEIEHLARLGVEASRLGGDAGWRGLVAGLVLPGQAQLDAGKYLSGLTRAVRASGVRVFEGTRVLDVDDGERCRVRTESGSVLCSAVVVASHVPIHTRVLLHTKLAAYRSYALALRVRGELPRGLFWDDLDPYHYVRTQRIDGEELVIVGGEDHRTGEDLDENAPFERLLAWSEQRFDVEAELYRWSGQILETADGLPYIGKSSFSDRVWVATGYRGNGMTLGTCAAQIVANRILGRSDEFEDVFDATRVTPIASAAAYVRENLTTARHLVADRLHASRGDPVALAVGEGGVFVEDGERRAISRDENGALVRLSATCPHLGCVVAWNSAEKSWDCPCHGSRFGASGKVINGPARTGLEPRGTSRAHDAQ